jgi:hypothetical protein
MAKLVIGPHVIGGPPPVEDFWDAINFGFGWAPIWPRDQVGWPLLCKCGPTYQLSLEITPEREIQEGDHILFTVVHTHPPGPVILDASYYPENPPDEYEGELYTKYVLHQNGDVTGPIPRYGYGPNHVRIQLYGAWIEIPGFY